MPRGAGATERYEAKRAAKVGVLHARIGVLETVITDVWRWRLNDGVDLDALRAILERADEKSDLVRALDALEGLGGKL